LMIPGQQSASDIEVPVHGGWQTWLESNFPGYVASGFAERHIAFWQWRDSITAARPRPFVALWPRGGGKSTTSELFICDSGCRLIRPYAVYVSETQEQADKHVASIATLFERVGASRAVNKFGTSKGWRRNRISVSNGFTVDALGLDTAARGIKLDENRPGLMVFDDIDGKHDTDKTTQKKIEILTNTLLPAMANNCAVLFVQNLIHRTSIASRLSNQVFDLKADFLVDRIISGPHRAIEGLETTVVYDREIGANRHVIVDGQATWAGQSREACQGAIDTYGLEAFLRESQHEVFGNAGALFNRDWFEIVDSVPRDAIRTRRWDEAATQGGGDWTAGVLMAKKGNTYFVEDVVREQLGPTLRDALMRKTADSDFEKYAMGVRQVGVQDPGSAGVDRAVAFKKLMLGYPIAIERETGDKELRADGFSKESGKQNVKLLRGAWNEAFLTELERFPLGEFDDQVDAAAGAYNRLAKKRDLQGAVG
jgi:predicted phage terminase large subunit-like protein